MAAAKNKKGFSIKFDLSLAGLFGVGVVCFCIFLWMFLMGIWSGQTFLSSGKQPLAGARQASIKTLQPIAKKPASPASTMEQAVVKPVAKVVVAPGGSKSKVAAVAAKKVIAKNTKAQPEPEADPAFFAVQVAAFKDSALAGKAVGVWRDKGYNSFSRPPEGAGDKFTRVYIGHFDSITAAKKKAAALAENEKIKPFIVLVPAE